jgi:hypothetical protein
MHTGLLDPIMEERLAGVDAECLHICSDWKARRQKGKLPDEAFLHDYAHYVLYYTHYVAWLNRIAAPVRKSYSLCFYAHALRVEQRAYATSGKLPLLSKVPKFLR